MADNRVRLYCLVEGDLISKAFPLTISLRETVAELRSAIHLSKPVWFKDLEAEDLTLWRAFIPDNKKGSAITIDTLDDKTEFDDPRALLYELLPENPDRNTYILVQEVPSPRASSHISQKRPYAEELDLPFNKKIRITEGWKQYTASDGKVVDLPPLWIDILASNEFAPEPRTAFHHLKNENGLQAGEAINMPNLGEAPKHFKDDVEHGQFFVTEQMLKLWDEIRGDQRKTYRRVLSGPMGVGKSYLSYFLAAKAYAEGWLVLYISDAAVLDAKTEDESELEVFMRFLALNKDILTGAELEMLVHNYDGTRNIATDTISVIFRKLLKSRERKTLLLVDEHGKLFEEKPYVPVKFKSLSPLSSYHWWGENAKGSRVIFTGTAHAKYEMTILDESYRSASVVFVGPLSRHVFSNLLDTYPFLAQTAIKREVTQITNCVPRELVKLAGSVMDVSVPVTLQHLAQWTEERAIHFSTIASAYYENLESRTRDQFHNALLHMFFGATCTVDFEWDFLDLGLIYRSKGEIGDERHILCRPAQKALLELFKTLPLPAATRLRICSGTLEGTDFEVALCHQLICTAKPILLNATDLSGKNPTTISLDFQHCETLRKDDHSLGPGHHDFLIRCYERYPRFDFILGQMFIQVSVSDFAKHNSNSADIRKAFVSMDTNGKNQIEKYLDDAYGPGHHAYIDARTNRFVVKQENEIAPVIRIVYIRGSPGKPNHHQLVKSFPDVLHVTFDELQRNLFRNIVTQSSME